MEIKKTIEGTEAVFQLEGWLDTKTAPVLGEALAELPEEVSKLTLDCEKLEYISSAGVRQLVTAHKKIDEFTLINVTQAIAEVLKLTGIYNKLNIVS